MAHQGRLCPDNQLMDLHLREIKWTKSGWPVVSPERFIGSKQTSISKKDIAGTWEIIRVQDAKADRKLEFGQILWGEGELRKTEVDASSEIVFQKNGKISGNAGTWKFDKDGLTLMLNSETITNLIVFNGHDWENETETRLFIVTDRKSVV